VSPCVMLQPRSIVTYSLQTLAVTLLPAFVLVSAVATIHYLIAVSTCGILCSY